MYLFSPESCTSSGITFSTSCATKPKRGVIDFESAERKVKDTGRSSRSTQLMAEDFWSDSPDLLTTSPAPDLSTMCAMSVRWSGAMLVFSRRSEVEIAESLYQTPWSVPAPAESSGKDIRLVDPPAAVGP